MSTKEKSPLVAATTNKGTKKTQPHCNRNSNPIQSDAAHDIDRHHVEAGEGRRSRKKKTIISDSLPMTLARQILAGFQHEDGKTLRRWQGQWYEWNRRHYVKHISEETLANPVRLRLSQFRVRIERNGHIKEECLKNTRSQVADVLAVLGAMVAVPDDAQQPCWLDSGHTANPHRIIAFGNGLLNVDEWLRGRDTLESHTPAWFSPIVLDYNYAGQAECPVWLEFLDQVFDEDRERIGVLQEWFGYNLLPDTRYQKIVMLVGPPRSGKGTVLRVLQSLIGDANCVTPVLSNLGAQFGLQSLVGKLAAICPDAHLGRRADSTRILELLKSITGEDSIEIHRKYKDSIPSAKLYARFTIAVNELPRFDDTGNALGSRLIILPFRNCYKGQEDFGLKDKLLAELPGICNWALRGLRSLIERGRFEIPSCSAEIMESYDHLCSPLKAFLDDACLVSPNFQVPAGEIYEAWKLWCELNGHVSGSRQWFGAQLRAAVPQLTVRRPGSREGRQRVYVGLKLRHDHCLGPPVSTVSA